MNPLEYLSPDGETLLLLCTAFALPPRAETSGLSPLKLSEWNELERRIRESPWKTPSALQGRPASEISKTLGIGMDEAERISALLDYSGKLSAELQTLFEQGLWVLSRYDEFYPAQLRDRLKHQAPAVLFGSGDPRLLAKQGVAVVGSRNIDEAGTEFARAVAAKAAAANLPVVSGGARGTDRIAMEAALQAGGLAFGALADSLERTAKQEEVRDYLSAGKLALITPYLPSAGFSVGTAMGRNKLIYGLARCGVVVSSEFQTGGTWAGATEALKANWCPVLARESKEAPAGNKELIKLGALPLSSDQLAGISDFESWILQRASPKESALQCDFIFKEKPEL